MAIIGNAYSTMKYINVNKSNLEIISSYMTEALNNSSDIYSRINSLPVGSFNRVNLTNEIFALEQVFYTKEREDCFFESHKKYIDLQLLIHGEELMEYAEIEKLCVKTKYNEATDFVIYTTPEKHRTSKFLLEKHDMAIYFSSDGHMGLSKSLNISKVFKTVVKVPCDIWNF
jgi:biofilm protein TabA